MCSGFSPYSRSGVKCRDSVSTVIDQMEWMTDTALIGTVVTVNGDELLIGISLKDGYSS